MSSDVESKDHNQARRIRPLLHLRDTQRSLVLVMVGLPARGKTYLSKKVSRYLSWLGYKTKVFNVGQYRRKFAGAQLRSDFFDPKNEEGSQKRNQCAEMALHDLWDFLQTGGQAAIYDATNTTKERRQFLRNFLRSHNFNGEILFIESICNDPQIIENNIRETKLFSPDYKGEDPEEAISDFRKRIENYASVYEEICDNEMEDDCLVQSYVKVIDAGKKLITFNLNGYLPGRICFFLQHLRLSHPQPIFMSRHGESLYNVDEKIGGDSNLSPYGVEYGKLLGQFLSHHPEMIQLCSEDHFQLQIWTSQLRRTIETAGHVVEALPKAWLTNPPTTPWRALSEIDAGIYDGLTYHEVEKKDPEGFAARQSDKLRYRYPQGESYLDLVERLEAVIFELERSTSPILVIGHQAILRCLIGYFVESSLSDIPILSVPLHTVIKLHPRAYGCYVEHYKLMEEPQIIRERIKQDVMKKLREERNKHNNSSPHAPLPRKLSMSHPYGASTGTIPIVSKLPHHLQLPSSASRSRSASFSSEKALHGHSSPSPSKPQEQDPINLHTSISAPSMNDMIQKFPTSSSSSNLRASSGLPSSPSFTFDPEILEQALAAPPQVSLSESAFTPTRAYIGASPELEPETLIARHLSCSGGR